MHRAAMTDDPGTSGGSVRLSEATETDAGSESTSLHASRVSSGALSDLLLTRTSLTRCRPSPSSAGQEGTQEGTPSPWAGLQSGAASQAGGAAAGAGAVG
jgi:hypothetical protein